ncbi:MAG: hypothetical protein U0M42_03710 [Acutalibacteraceae bacterium]|nr:hypothetical protein [Acutalibacteraceae bacterium]
MKKIFALVLVVALVLSFSVPAFAIKSSGGTVYHEVIVNRTNDGKNSAVADRVTVEKDGTIALKPVENDSREFEGWKFYKPNKSPALAGTDYEIVSVTLANGQKAVEGTDYTVKNGEIVSVKGDYLNVVIKPLSDTVYVSEAYEGVEIKFNVPKDTVNPLTGESVNLSVVFTLVMLVMGGVVLAVSSKRAYN